MEMGTGKQSRELDVTAMHGLTLVKDTSPPLIKLQLLMHQHCSESKSEEFFSLIFFLQDRVPIGRSSISHLLYGSTSLNFASFEW